jgi:hypothetical protein
MKLNALESHTVSVRSRDSSVGIATGTMTEKSGFRFPAGAGHLSLSQSIQTTSGAQLPSFLSNRYRGFLGGIMRQELEAEHSHQAPK